MRHVIGGAVVATLLLAIVPAVALAHPLGNFTINHYAGIRVSATAVDVDVVIDQAEIPTFEARQALDTNGDGDVSAAEADAARGPQCAALIRSLELTVAGRPMPMVATAAGIAFPTGAGGLPTMRLVCELRASLDAPLAPGTAITFTDRSFAERIGWREMTVVGDGVTVAPASLPSDSVSARLTRYPTDLLQQPLAVTSLTFAASPGGPAARAFVAPDARPLTAAGGTRAAGAADAAPGRAVSVPGGIGSEIDALLRTPDISPVVLLGSILAAVALGAGHAITPGHGKTLMGAYLIGTRGSPLHAVVLGLAVAVSHTLGILALALVVLVAGATLPPEQFQRVATVGSAVALTAIGGWLLVGQARRHRRGGGARGGHGHAHDHAHDHAGDGAGDHRPGHEDAHPGGHVAPLSWRSLFVLGLAGGLVPSTNALLILLATIATNRPAFGFVLVLAFGVGMAAVMAGVGLTLIHARDWLAARPRTAAFDRLAAWAPTVAAAFVLVLGVVLTTQAVGAARL